MEFFIGILNDFGWLLDIARYNFCVCVRKVNVSIRTGGSLVCVTTGELSEMEWKKREWNRKEGWGTKVLKRVSKPGQQILASEDRNKSKRAGL